MNHETNEVPPPPFCERCDYREDECACVACLSCGERLCPPNTGANCRMCAGKIARAQDVERAARALAWEMALERAIDEGTDAQVMTALAALLAAMLLSVRAGEVLTADVIQDRSNNVAQVLAPMMRR
jgi:hypothetical protein